MARLWLSWKVSKAAFILKHTGHLGKARGIYFWRRQWHPTPVLLPGNSHGRRSLVGCSPGGTWELDMTQWLHFHFPFSCIGEGNGNPLQCSCLKNPRDGGAWWAAIYGVAQSRTWLKRLSSSRGRHQTKWISKCSDVWAWYCLQIHSVCENSLAGLIIYVCFSVCR